MMMMLLFVMMMMMMMMMMMIMMMMMMMMIAVVRKRTSIIEDGDDADEKVKRPKVVEDEDKFVSFFAFPAWLLSLVCPSHIDHCSSLC